MESNEEQLLPDTEIREVPGVVWQFTGTAAPVQAEGTIDGIPFYFRSRWDRWTFGVASLKQPDPVLVESEGDAFFRTEKYRKYRFSASFMPLNEAKEIIERCILAYIAWRDEEVSE